MVKYLQASAAGLAAALTLAGCGGSLGQGGVVPARDGVHASILDRNARRAPLRLEIKIPKNRHRHHRATGHRDPNYVSPATQGISIDITGTATYSTVAALTVSSGNCTSTLASTICTLTTPGLPVGSYTASVETYDAVSCSAGACGIPPYANLLSDAQGVGFTLVAGQNNTIALTLGGDAAGLVVAPVTNYRMSGSGGHYNVYGNDAVKFSVFPVDADDNIIIGAGAPQPSVSLAAGAQATVGAVGSAAPNEFTLTSSYQPSDPAIASNSSITVSATPVPGSEGSAVSATIPVSLYQPWIYVSDDSSSTIKAYDEDGNPKAVGGFATGLNSPSGMTYDPHNGWLYAAQYSGTVAAFDRTGTFETTFSVSPGASNEVAFDPNNDWLYVIGYNGNGAAYDEQGNVQATSGGFPGLNGPHQAAFDTQTNQLYVTNNNDGTVAVYDETGASVTTGGGFPSAPSSISGIAYDPHHGWLWASNQSTTLAAYDGDGNLEFLKSSLSGTSSPFNLAFDPYNGLVYVTNRSNGSVTAYDQAGNRHVLPTPVGGFSDVQGIVVVR